MPRAQFHTRTETKSKKATVALSPFFHAWKIAINVVVNVQHVFLFFKNVGWVYRSLEFDNAILREGDLVTVGAGIILR